MDFKGKLLRILIALVLVVVAGTVGYMLIEGWSWLDSLYMTVITISTVGYREIQPPSDAGKFFTMFVILGGTGTMVYGVSTLAQYLIAGELAGFLGRRRMKEEISKLKGHIILCGYGKVGEEVARVLKDEGARFLVVEAKQEIAEQARNDGYLCVHGDATTDKTLQEAGIYSARALVTALATDADNLYVTLSAKGLKPDIFVVSRVYSEDSEVKLQRAGADRTMSPYRIGGRQLAMLTLRPMVVDFLDTAMGGHHQRMVFENIVVRSGSQVAGVTMSEWLQQCGGAQILAVKKKDGNLLTNPQQETRLEIGDELVVVGTPEQLRAIDPLLE